MTAYPQSGAGHHRVSGSMAKARLNVKSSYFSYCVLSLRIIRISARKKNLTTGRKDDSDPHRSDAWVRHIPDNTNKLSIPIFRCAGTAGSNRSTICEDTYTNPENTPPVTELNIKDILQSLSDYSVGEKKREKNLQVDNNEGRTTTGTHSTGSCCNS